MTPRESLMAAMAALSACRNDQTDSHAVRLVDTQCAEYVRHYGRSLLAALDDAERYRWLRDNTDPPSGPFAWASNYDYEAKWDAAIDAVRKA